MDNSVCAAVPDLHILVVLRQKDKVGVKIFEDLLIRLGSEEGLDVLIMQLLPGLVGLFVDEGPRGLEESACFGLDHSAVSQHEVRSSHLAFPVLPGQL